MDFIQLPQLPPTRNTNTSRMSETDVPLEPRCRSSRGPRLATHKHTLGQAACLAPAGTSFYVLQPIS